MVSWLGLCNLHTYSDGGCATHSHIIRRVAAGIPVSPRIQPSALLRPRSIAAQLFLFREDASSGQWHHRMASTASRQKPTYINAHPTAVGIHHLVKSLLTLDYIRQVKTDANAVKDGGDFRIHKVHCMPTHEGIWHKHAKSSTVVSIPTIMVVVIMAVVAVICFVVVVIGIVIGIVADHE